MPGGSSPHTRGTPQWLSHRRPARRFIPAYAGNAARAGLHVMSTTVHPRIRGERLAKSPRNSHTAGSSPHTRGTHSARLADPQDDRFIPAYAGNAPVSAAARLPATVHPRIRGERAGRAHRARRASGSSPHTRGTLGFRQLQRRRQRFIPAYAGNARLLVPARRADAVHPRIRGERKLAKLPPEKVAGSSPHTRGTRAHGEHVRCASRFIPAYAGNAGSARAGACTAAVHPRIRGERTSNKLLIYRRKSEPSDSTKHSAC